MRNVRLVFSVEDSDTKEQLFPKSQVRLSFEGINFAEHEQNIRDKFRGQSEEALQQVIRAERLSVITDVVDAGFHAVRNAARRTLVDLYTKDAENQDS